MKAWHLFLLIGAMFNAAQYIVYPYAPAMAAWLLVPLLMFVGLSAWAAWYEGKHHP